MSGDCQEGPLRCPCGKVHRPQATFPADPWEMVDTLWEMHEEWSAAGRQAKADEEPSKEREAAMMSAIYGIASDLALGLVAIMEADEQLPAVPEPGAERTH